MMSRPFIELIRAYEADPSRWQVTEVNVAPSSNIRNRGGTSIQEVLTNHDTGEVIVRHTLRKADGSFFAPPHFRPNLK